MSLLSFWKRLNLASLVLTSKKLECSQTEAWAICPGILIWICLFFEKLGHLTCVEVKILVINKICSRFLFSHYKINQYNSELLVKQKKVCINFLSNLLMISNFVEKGRLRNSWKVRTFNDQAWDLILACQKEFFYVKINRIFIKTNP